MALTAIIAIMCVQIAFADEAAGAVTDSIRQQFLQIYGILENIALFGGAFGLAVCGYIMAKGQDTAMEKAKSAARYVVIAMVCVKLLPLAIRLGKQAFSLSWDPSRLG